MAKSTTKSKIRCGLPMDRSGDRKKDKHRIQALASALKEAGTAGADSQPEPAIEAAPEDVP